MQMSTSNPTITQPLPAEEITRIRITGSPAEIEFYEAAIATDDTIIDNYWYLGVAYLLAGREDDAQAAWFAPLGNVEATEIDPLTQDLCSILEQSATDQADTSNLNQAWLIRQHLWMLAPSNIENILKLILLVSSIGELPSESLAEWEIEELLSEAEIGSIDEDLLEDTILVLMRVRTQRSLDTIEYCLHLINVRRKIAIEMIVKATFTIFHVENAGEFAAKLGEICQRLEPENLSVLKLLASIYSGCSIYDLSKATAQKYYQLAPGISEKLFASYLLQKAYLGAGESHGNLERVAEYRELLTEIIQLSPRDLNPSQRQGMMVSSFFLPYTEDNPRINKPLQNQLATLFQNNVDVLAYEPELGELSPPKKVGCLRIGYVGSTMKMHSVGWLCRWLISHYDRESFQTFAYFLTTNQDDEFNHQWFRDKVDVSYHFDGQPDLVIAQIKADCIDILIDLDSLTLDFTCLIMASKPAPIQVSWLGWDSTGIPAVDYFIADPYVLPNGAQDYYQEKIWRLPNTYLAVDGFEVGVPTLRREDLNIPIDAVVYLCSQTGYKRHPDNIRCQMKILKAVPNSYFLIKGKGDAEIIQNLFGKMAEEEGISLDRLRFLERDRDEYTHRANLAIADIVLDTFPYNGATTTLETLWMGIPLVTQVGEQFAARNSYTFMMNAGITEGIAWSEQEYIDWGIKLGLDRELRWQIKGKLHDSRATAPVWNAKQFTLDMEQAYRQMWAKYQSLQDDSAIDLNSHN